MTVTVEQAQNALTELIDRTARGEKVVITRGDQPVAELVPVPVPMETHRPRFGSCKGMLETPKDDERPGPAPTARPQPKPGFAKGVLTIVADDDDHLADFKDYMPSDTGSVDDFFAEMRAYMADAGDAVVDDSREATYERQEGETRG